VVFSRGRSATTWLTHTRLQSRTLSERLPARYVNTMLCRDPAVSPA